MRKIGVKGYKIRQDGKGKVTLERIPFYGRDTSAKIRGRKSKTAKPVPPMAALLFGKGRPA